MKHQVKKRTGRGGVSCITSRKRSFNTLLIFFLLFATASLTIGTTSAQALEMDFNIQAQDLSSALKTFAEDTGLQMLYSSDTVKGIRSSRVNGKHQPKEALDVLLQDTGLSFKFTDPNTVVVQKNEVRKGKKLIAQRDVGKREAAGEKEEVKRPVEMEQMTVTATKSKMNVREVPAAVNVVTAEDIELMPVADTFAQALKHIPGIHYVHELGEPRITLRGQRPAFLLNGREMSQFFGGYHFHARLLGMDTIERIEVIRGPQSAVHGSKAISGVVNIITKKGDKDNPYVKIHALAGTGEELHGGMSFSGGYDRLSYFITGSGWNQNKTETPRGDSKEEGTSRDIYSRFDYDFNDNHTVTLEYMNSVSWRIGYFQYPHQYYTPSWRLVSERDPTDIQTLFLSYNGKITDRFSLYADVGFGEYNFGWKNGRTVEDYNDPALQDTLEYLEDMKWGEIRGNFDIFDEGLLTATAGVQYKETDLDWSCNDPVGYGSPINYTIKETEKYTAPYLQLESKPIDYLLASAGVRYDKYSYSEGSDKEKTSPKVGLSIFPFAQTNYDWTTLWASYSEGFQVPTGAQLYFPGVGNPDLEPEESDGWEIGLKQRVGQWANIEFTYFDTDFTEKIEFDYAARKFMNIGEANVKGYELLGEVYPVEFLRLFATWTDFEQKDTKNNTVIYGEPHNILTVGFSIEDFHGFYLSLTGVQQDDWEEMGWGWTDPADHPSEGDWLWDTKLSYNWNITSNALFKPFISVENLADKEYYPGGLVREGRAWHVGATLKVNF